MDVSGRPVSVLVVDDSEDLRELLTMLIDRHAPSWQVVGTATHGREAVSAAVETRPDVVLLDVAMPVMDGMQALPLIREAVPTAVVVMLSGYPVATAGPPAIKAGAHGYLEKADLFETLIPQLGRILEAVRSEPAS